MRRLGALLLVGALPWTVLVGADGVQLVFLWGLANPATGHVVSLPEYLFALTSGLPDRLLAWPASTVLYAGVLVAAGLEERQRGDARVTAGLLGLAGLAHLAFVTGLLRRGSSTVLPLGPVLVGVVVWWFYWPALRGAIDRER